MSQPAPPNKVHSPDPDPLLEFFAEPGAEPAAVAAAPANDSAEPVENAELAAAPVAAPIEPAPDPEMRRRLDRAERMLEKAQIEISSIKTDVATLVTAIDDIKKRQSRPIEKPAVVAVSRPPRLSRGAAAAVTAAGVLLVVVAWGMWSLPSYDLPGLTTTELQAAPEPDAPAPVPAATVDTTPVEIQPAAAISVVEPPHDAAPQPERPNSVDRVDRVDREPPPAIVKYVGTLSIDAAPGGEVFLNRKRVGNTPVRLEGLRAGSHLVWIERDGFQRWTRVVTVAANRVSRVSAELDPVR